MARLYATLAQYREYVDDQGALVSPRELAQASRFVEAATTGAWYATDSLTGMPTDPAVLAAFTEATCELLAHRADSTPPADVQALRRAGVKRATVNGASYELDAATVMADDGTVPADVDRILRQAGLRAAYVYVVG